jgi:hypothetical protein
MDTPEADIQLGDQRVAFANRIEQLLLIPKRTTPQERELRHASRILREIDAGRLGPTLIERRLSEFGQVGQRQGLLAGMGAAGLGGWLVGAGVFATLLAGLVFQTVRLGNVKADLVETRADLDNVERALADARAVQEALAANIEAAAEETRESAATIERERARNAVARRRERELLREIQERTANVGEPPDWSLRNGAGGDSAGPGPDPSGDPS